MLWRSASEPWHRAWRLILREDGFTARGEGRARQPRGCLWGQGGRAGQAQPLLPPHLLLQPLLGHRWRMWWGWGQALPGGRGGW